MKKFAILVTLTLTTGCATTTGALLTVCEKEAAIRAAAEATIEALNQCPFANQKKD